MKTDKYYGYSDPKIPDNNKGTVLDGNFYAADEKSISSGYYKKQMAANEYKDFIGPRVKANNERSEQEQLDPRIIDTANLILQHQEKMKQRIREKYRKNNVAYKKKEESVVSAHSTLAYSVQKKNLELEQIHNTIEEQQDMILELVNNVVTDRERELKRQNDMLRERIERLEQSMVLEEAKREEMHQRKYLEPVQNMKKTKNKHHDYYGDESDDSDDSDEDSSEDDDSNSDNDSDDSDDGNESTSYKH